MLLKSLCLNYLQKKDEIENISTEFIIEKSPKKESTLIIDYDKEVDKSVVSEPTEDKKSSKKKPKDD